MAYKNEAAKLKAEGKIQDKSADALGFETYQCMAKAAMLGGKIMFWAWMTMQVQNDIQYYNM